MSGAEAPVELPPELDLKVELPEGLKMAVREMAFDFFMAGGALTFDEWVHLHPSARRVFVQARDEVEVERLQYLAKSLRGGG